MFFSSAMVVLSVFSYLLESAKEDPELDAVVLERDDLVTGALGEALEVLLGGGVVGDDLQDFADLDRVDALARLEQRLGTVQPDAVERECRLLYVCHVVSLRVGGAVPVLAPG